MEISDTYKTIDFPSQEILFKEKNSKFFGYAFPLTWEEEVKSLLETLRKKHYNAGHFCYAFQTGTQTIYFRTNDDGEPNGTAGLPIYGQLQSFDVTNILVVVVRYFGGTKLGVGGLIQAYKSTAQQALENADIVEKTMNVHYLISFDYKNINKVMRIIKEKKLEIKSQKMELNCEVEISTRKNSSEMVYEVFNNLYEIAIKIKE